MMNRKHSLDLFIVFIAFVVIIGCSKKVYQNDPYILLKSTPSKINNFERIDLRDTSLGNFKGVITERDSSKFGIDTVSAVFAIVLSFDSITKKVKGIACDFDGSYSLYVNPGTYQFEVRNRLKNRLVIRDIKIEAGEKIIIDALLGDGSDSTIYEVKDDLILLKTYSPQ